MLHILERAAPATTAKVTELLLWLAISMNSTGIVSPGFPLQFAFD